MTYAELNERLKANIRRNTSERISREVDELVRAIQQQEYAAIEDACRRAVEGGRHGVRVERVDGKLISVEVDSGVPYGQLHEHLHNSWSHVQPGAYEDLLCEMVRGALTSTPT